MPSSAIARLLCHSRGLGRLRRLGENPGAPSRAPVEELVLKHTAGSFEDSLARCPRLNVRLLVQVDLDRYSPCRSLEYMMVPFHANGNRPKRANSSHQRYEIGAWISGQSALNHLNRAGTIQRIGICDDVDLLLTHERRLRLAMTPSCARPEHA